MPDYIWYTSFSSGTVWDDTSNGSIYPQNDKLMQQMYDDYKQAKEEAEEEAEDKRKYPLFYWKENIK